MEEVQINPNDPYELVRIDQNKNDLNVICDICLDDDDEEDDEIVICELCLVATHQKCYGSSLKDKIPTGEWYCARCSYLKANPEMKCTEIKCMFCPNIDGIIKPISCGTSQD